MARDAKLIADGQVIPPATPANQVQGLAQLITQATATLRNNVAAALVSANRIITKTSKLQVVPTLNRNAVYTGAAVGPELLNYNSRTMILEGDYQAVSAGNYTLVVAPATGFTWPDGSTGGESINWSVEKATGHITFDKDHLDFDEGVVDTFTVFIDGTGTISAASDDTSVATVSVSQSTVSVTAIAPGTTNIRVNVTSPNYTYEEKVMVVTTE